MAPKARPYDQFGPFILFKKLEADSLGDLWRAAQIVGANETGPLLALRRLAGGHRTGLQESAAAAGPIAAQLNATTFVKNQVIDEVDGVPFVAFEYPGGRSLRHIIDRARGGTNATPNPLPIDLALLIAGRVAQSLSTLSDMRHGSERLLHGALIPQFIWISDDGEVRVAGQHLGRGIIASLGDPKVNNEIGRYFSPEYHSAGTPSRSSEVYSLGAMLYLLITGVEPPDPLSVTAFTSHVRAAKTMAGQPIPLEVRQILDKSLVLDITSRYPSVAEMKQAIDLASAKYSSTTFNLAFYLSTLLKKELEAEAAEREKESKVNVAAYTESPAAAPEFTPSAAAEPAKSRMPMIAAAAVALLAIAGGAAYFAMKPSTAATAAVTQTHAPAPKPPVQIVSQPIVASPNGTTTAPVTTASVDPNAAKKAFEDAVNQKMQEEMLKLQANFNKQLQQTKSKNAPVVTEAPPPREVAQPKPAPVEEAPSAAALDERRLAATQTQAAAAVPAPVQPQPQAVAAAPAPAPVQATIHEGDVIEADDLDAIPKPTRLPTVAYPAPALRMRIETSVIVTALVSEDGNVIDVKILRGDPRFGFNDSAMRAVRTMRFTPPMKGGVRVKTWFPQTINFKL